MYVNLAKITIETSARLLRLCKQHNRDEITRPIISQLIRSGTSVGANFCEVADAYSKSEYLHRISICRKESKESNYWLVLLIDLIDDSEAKKELFSLADQYNQLNLIFSKIIVNSKTKQT